MTDTAQTPTTGISDDAQSTGVTPSGGGSKSRIPAAVAQKYPDLEKLIVETESMTDEERDYWFQILPIMTDEQIQKLVGILIHEKEQLAKLDEEYESELAKLNEKHLLEWKDQETKEKREKLKSAESSAEAEEKAAEAALLAQLDNEEESSSSR